MPSNFTGLMAEDVFGQPRTAEARAARSNQAPAAAVRQMRADDPPAPTVTRPMVGNFTVAGLLTDPTFWLVLFLGAGILAAAFGSGAL